MAKPELIATITEDLALEYGGKVFPVWNQFQLALMKIGSGKKVRVDLKRWYKKRTLAQNAYLFGVVYPSISQYIKDVTGELWGIEDIHDWAMREFFGYETYTLPGSNVPLTRRKSSTKLDTNEFWWELTEKVCRHFSENMGLYIPLPERKP